MLFEKLCYDRAMTLMKVERYHKTAGIGKDSSSSRRVLIID